MVKMLEAIHNFILMAIGQTVLHFIKTHIKWTN